MPLLFSVSEIKERNAATRLSAATGWLLVSSWSCNFLSRIPHAPHGTAVWISGTCFSGAVCLVEGHSPYRFESVQASLSAHGFYNSTLENWNKTLPLYPPSTLVLFYSVYISLVSQMQQRYIT